MWFTKQSQGRRDIIPGHKKELEKFIFSIVFFFVRDCLATRASSSTLLLTSHSEG